MDKDLHYSDLFSRRPLLTDEEVASIMAANKLLSICLQQGLIADKSSKISVARLGFLLPHEIGGLDIFDPTVSVLKYTPEEPPLVTLMTLPGSHRRYNSTFSPI